MMTLCKKKRNHGNDCGKIGRGMEKGRRRRARSRDARMQQKTALPKATVQCPLLVCAVIPETVMETNSTKTIDLSSSRIGKVNKLQGKINNCKRIITSFILSDRVNFSSA